MIDAPRMLLLGSTGRDSGRTDFACALLSRLQARRRVVAIKVTAVREAQFDCARECEGCGVCTDIADRYQISREEDRGRGKDTERMSAAGAAEVYWLKARHERFLEEGMAALLAEVAPDALVICLSNALRAVVDPALFLLFRAPDERPADELHARLRAAADRAVARTTDELRALADEITVQEGTWAMPLEATAIILAGGASSRMERDKSLLPIAGVPMVQHIQRRLAPHFREILISANDVAKYAFVGVPVVPDRVAGLGPTAGIAAALARSHRELNFVTACDMPAVDPALVRRMLREAREYDAVVPVADGMIEPLCAIYRRGMASVFEEALAEGRRRIRDVFGQCRVNYLEIGALSAPENLNTWEDYAGYLARDTERPVR